VYYVIGVMQRVTVTRTVSSSLDMFGCWRGVVPSRKNKIQHMISAFDIDASELQVIEVRQ